MPRNAEVIRQWTLLRHLAAGRTNTIPKLARELGVTTRTIRRDLAALQMAGFPIYDETVNGTKFWRMEAKAFGAVARNALSFPELCALYFSRALLECFAGTHLAADLESALDKVEAALTPQMKRFLDRLPRAIRAKGGSSKQIGKQTYAITSQLLEAILSHRVLEMRYHSKTSRREKEYVVHPHRLVHAQGGLYLIAYVPAYKELRTFAVERIRRLAQQDRTFEPIPELEADPFQNSMGVYRGKARTIKLRFDALVAPGIRERLWHASQQFRDHTDGSVTMTLEVCDDYALRSWILGFGRHVRVVSPADLAEWAMEELEQARQQYDGMATTAVDSELQPVLPFLFGRLAGAATQG
ncbi:MAG TPA: transcriptional regulator [Vicinamibacterales bacterium]|nr:transcriptional regulator [Vicinamibacterales bacterium]